MSVRVKLTEYIVSVYTSFTTLLRHWPEEDREAVQTVPRLTSEHAQFTYYIGSDIVESV